MNHIFLENYKRFLILKRFLIYKIIVFHQKCARQNSIYHNFNARLLIGKSNLNSVRCTRYYVQLIKACFYVSTIMLFINYLVTKYQIEILHLYYSQLMLLTKRTEYLIHRVELGGMITKPPTQSNT